MDLAFSAEDRAFRDEVRRFVAERLPADIRARWADTAKVLYADRVDGRRWQKILHERGWSVPAWPKEHGGPGWTVSQLYIFDVETALAGAPPLPLRNVAMVGPVIIAYGTPEQQRRFLPPIVSADAEWAQGYSEPGSGSDLASLRTRAVRDGDDYIVDGAKIWTTGAHESDWIFCLVRTSTGARKQEGITFLLIDMASPGITVRPLPFMTGVHEFNEVFFEGVRVPEANRIGREGQGWEIAKYLLEYERGGAFVSGRLQAQIARLRRAADAGDGGGRRVLDDPDFARRLAEIEVQAEAVAWTELRILDRVARGERPGPESSIVKLLRTEMSQAITELTMAAAGWYAHPHEPSGQENAGPVVPPSAVNATSLYFNHRANSIMGGTSEVQRSVMAKAMLGL